MIENTEEDRSTVYALPSSWTLDDIDTDTPYLATVNGVVPYGVFVDVTDHISGLVHESKLSERYTVGEELAVEIESIQENGDIAFREVPLHEYDIAEMDGTREPTKCSDVAVDMNTATIHGRVAQVKQTSGPTIFHVTDGTGVIPCAAFAAAGVRAYPAIGVGDVVRIDGVPSTHGEGIQIEAESVESIPEEDEDTVASTIEEALSDHAAPHDIDPLVDWPALDALWEELQDLARLLRRAVLEHRPVLIRHHADGDGMCAAVPVALALERFINQTHGSHRASDYLVTRSPSRAPYYEMEDSTRDLNRALKDRSQHGQRLPFLLMLDNGSTEEDVPGYRNLAHYDIPIAVVDHHHPDPDAVRDLLASHVNPYLVDEDYRVTTGMLCVELARMIAPEISDQIDHVPAVAGIADRSEARAVSDYLNLAQQNGYSREDITQVGDALDYASHWLRFQSGERVVRDVLGVNEDSERHDQLVTLLADEAREAIDTQLEASLPHVTSTRLANGASLHRVDLDAHAHRFQYPAPGRTTGAIHDHMVEREEEPTITIGYGPDFCVLRSDGVRLDIPVMVDELQDEIAGGGVTGGGHLVVGSIKFVAGRRETVIEALIEKMASAELDEALTSTHQVPDGT